MGESMDVKFARMEEQMKTIFKQNETLTKQQETLAEEVRELVAAMNRGKGAFGFAMMLAAAMGAAAVKLLGVFIGRM